MNLLQKDGEAYLVSGVFAQQECRRYEQEILSSCPWRHEEIRLFGKKVLQPRLTCWMGEKDKSYTYSGITMHPEPWSEVTLQIKDKVEELCGHRFTNALINLYRNGKDSMGWHRDNEKELGENPLIASVSFGATRRFVFRHHYEKNLRVSIPLRAGDVLIMKGVTQNFWQHSLPKDPRVDAIRINLTFRRLEGAKQNSYASIT